MWAEYAESNLAQIFPGISTISGKSGGYRMDLYHLLFIGSRLFGRFYGSQEYYREKRPGGSAPVI